VEISRKKVDNREQVHQANMLSTNVQAMATQAKWNLVNGYGDLDRLE